jgi:hypothetical protein
MHDIAAGSGAILRGAEVVLGLDIVKAGETRLYVFKHRDGDDELPVFDDPWTLTFSRETGYERQHRDTTRGDRKASADDIAEWIRDPKQGGRARPGEIKTQFGIGDATLRNRRPSLAEIGIAYDATDPQYVDTAVHPAPRAPRQPRGTATAGAEPLFQAENDPAPRAPRLEHPAGQEVADLQDFSEPRAPRSLKGVAPSTAGSGSTPDGDLEDEPQIDWHDRSAEAPA